MLLFDVAPADSLPGDLRAVLPYALGSTRVRADRKLGLFWEVYDVTSPTEPVSASLAVTLQGDGWLRRTAASLGLVSRSTSVSLDWEEMPAAHLSDGAISSRALAVDLSALSPGRYRIELTVAAPGEVPVTTSREIQLVRP